MLTAWVLIQCAVNAALVAVLFLLLRERLVTARAMRIREERLESLAAEVCALGRAVVGEVDPTRSRTATPETPPVSPPPGARQPAPAPGSEPAEAPRADISGRVQAVATFLDQGLSVEAVADRTAMPEGEVQVLKNLRRAQKPAGPSAPGRRGAAASKKGRAVPPAELRREPVR